MSRKEEILHKLSTEDRNYIKKKFKEREEFCIGQVESLTNLINILIEENKELVDENFKLETKLAESKEQLIAMNEKSNKIKKESYYFKQQLAEKEKEISELKKCGDVDHFHSLLEEQKKEKVIFMNKCEKLLESQNQTAIAELKQVKAYIHKNIFIMDGDDVDDLERYFDKRIKSLNGGGEKDV